MTIQLRVKQNAPLPDSDSAVLSEEVRPHPDGRAWRKACPECALRNNDPQGNYILDSIDNRPYITGHGTRRSARASGFQGQS